MTTLAARLRWLRHNADLTLAEVAQRAHISVSFLSDVERGRTLPSLDTLERIAQVYHLSLGECLVNVTVLTSEGEVSA